ncbi:MAG TPA: ORF6N domain-containing protein, partial [bacterium]|nr:ORF6N domain-containing protein [bacterium]
EGVTLKILTRNVTKQLQLDIQKFNKQFPSAEIQKFDHSHDRFLIVDNSICYLFGASLKDLGKKWFGFAKMDIGTAEILAKLSS